VATKLVAGHPNLAGLPSSVPFLVLFAVLLSSRRGRFVEVVDEQRSLRLPGLALSRPFPGKAMLVTAAVAVAIVPRFNDSQILSATTTAAFVLVFASLGLLVGQARLVSLCQAAFVALGATTLAHLLSAGVPYLPALLLAGLVVAPLGALLAVPAVRLPGLFLAVATFGFGVLAQDLVFPTGFAFGSRSLAQVPRPAGFTGETAFFVFTLIVVVAGIAAVEWLRTGRLGTVLQALADSPAGVESIGVNPTASRVLVFTASAFLAAIAGGLLGSVTQTVSPATFTATDSLVWLAVLVAAGPTSFSGAVLAGLLYNQLPALVSSSTILDWLPVGFGVAAVVLAQTPDGLSGLLHLDFARLAATSRHRLSRSPHRDRRTALGRLSAGSGPSADQLPTVGAV